MLKRHAGLLVLALAAFGLVAARAAIQSIVTDEADSYFLFAAGGWESVFWPSSGNHVLNTLLTALTLTFLPLSELTVRLPALLGAAIYIAAAFYICTELANQLLFRLCLFVCLVYNPFVLDYLVAARGYSLAIGLLLAAIALLAGAFLGDAKPNAVRVALASLSLGLSFCANFSFAFADGMVMLVSLAFTLPRADRRLKLTAAGIIPGVCVALLICGSTLQRWPGGQLSFGAHSLVETWRGLVSASFDILNEHIVGHWLSFISWRYAALSSALALVAVAVALAMFFTNFTRRGDHREEARGPLVRFAGFLLLILTLTLVAHWIAFKAFQLLLPENRTGLFLVLFFTLFLGAAVASRLRVDGSRIVSGVGMAVLLFNATYFLGCLRLTYFKEWRYNADTKEIYWRLVDLNRRCGIDHFSTEWRYVGPLNFYRRAYGNRELQEFVRTTPNVPGERAYVAYYADSRNFVRAQGLAWAYFNPETLAAVAVRDCPVAPLANKAP